MTEWGFETKAIHSGLIPSQHQGATAIPIYETTAYAYECAQEIADVFDGKKFGHIYSRISNPTVTAFEQRINALEKGIGAVATSSGMAAISTALFTLVAQGDEIVSSKSLFAGTFLLFNRIFKKYGVQIKYVDPNDIDGIRSAITHRTQMIFAETLGNPKLDVPDIEKIAGVALENKIPFVVDSTLTTPYLVHLKELGAAIVIHSTTKYITGNGSTIGGVIVDLGNFDWETCKNRDLSSFAKEYGSDFALLISARRHIVQNMGNCPSPFNAYLQCLGLETLAVRMERHCSNAMDLADFLNHHQKVSGVNYPGLKTSPHHEIARSQFKGRFGGILTFKLGSKQQCFQLIDHLELVRNLANLGDAKTLIIHPASTIYHECSEEEMAGAGVSQDMIRVSVGIETIDDIIQDFDRGLKEVSS